MKMKQGSTNKHKKKPRIFILLVLALGLLIGWLIVLLLWPATVQESTEEQSTWKQPIEKIKNFLEETSKDVSIKEKKEPSEADLADGHGISPSMKELSADRPFDKSKFDARFNAMKRPIVSQKDLPHSTFGKKVAFIYHSHSRESFLPYFPETDNPKDAYHESRNITQVGEMLQRSLENQGIGTVVDTSDIINELDEKGLDFSSSYEITRQHIQAARSTNRDLTLFLDIHRDSVRKQATTATIQGQPFAKVFFVAGTSHSAFESNIAFIEDLNQQLDKKYPGLSKGIFQKDSSQGNGVYNQDVSATSVLIEIGGVDSTIEELQRTTEALAEVLGEVYWHAEQ